MINLKRILVPVDFSDGSALALNYGASFARQYGAEVHLLHVFEEEFMPPMPMEMPMTLPAAGGIPQQDIHEQMRQFVGDGYKDLSIVTTVLGGNVATNIIEYAADNRIDLIIIGAHGRSGILTTLLGDTSYAVTRQADCPVLTVRDTQRTFIDQSEIGIGPSGGSGTKNG